MQSCRLTDEEIAELIRHLKTMETKHSRRQLFNWETRSMEADIRKDVERRVLEQWNHVE